uniref:Uncharacterized protein n=1 Tax=Amphimedon queenslandica TaxID=400682 RepID=A0A1X7VJ17_AMPQE
MEKFVMSTEVQMTVKRISEKRRIDSDDETKITRANLKRRSQFLEDIWKDQEDTNEDDEVAEMDKARNVLGIPSMKLIKMLKVKD